MQVTAKLAAAALATTALAGGVAGAAVHAATANVQVSVECPSPAAAPADDLRRFMSRPAPPITGGRQF